MGEKNSLRNLKAIVEMRHVSKIPEESKEKMGQKKYWKKTQIDSPKCAKRNKYSHFRRQEVPMQLHE